MTGPLFDRATFTYDFWVGDGPSEEDGDISFEANTIDNNENKAVGFRLALWPTPLATFGFSFMGSRWNSSNTDGLFPHDRLHYTALCADWNWNFGDYINFRGEYLWTQYDFTPDDTVRRHGYWAEFSFFLKLLSCVNQNLYCAWPCFWDSLQFGLRSERLWSTRSIEERTRFALELNYYLTETAMFQFEYDFNGGAPGYKEDVFAFRFYWDW